MMRRVLRRAFIVALLGGIAATPAGAEGPDGAALFQRTCATCHASPAADSRAPSLSALQPRTPESIIDVLVTGAMRVQGSRLSGAERRAIAEYITHKTISGEVTGAATGRCTAGVRFRVASHQPHWSGWSAAST